MLLVCCVAVAMFLIFGEKLLMNFKYDTTTSAFLIYFDLDLISTSAIQNLTTYVMDRSHRNISKHPAYDIFCSYTYKNS